MFLIYVNLIKSAVFGIDYGHENIKVGMALPGKSVHVALNQQSKRLSPSFFAFWNISSPTNSQISSHWSISDIDECNWAYLDAAKNHNLRFPGNGIKGFMPLLSSEHGFTRRESMALVLRHLICTVDEMRWKPETAQVSLSVEPFLSFQERYALQEVMELVNATFTGIVDSPTAAAYVYSLEKQILYQDNSKIVVFIDMGGQGTWASVFKFEPNDNSPIVTQLSIETNSSLGGNTMDSILANYLYQKFVEKNKVETSSKRVHQRFLEESRRSKEILTLNRNVDIKLEDVVDDFGLYYELTRDEFESLIQEYSISLQNLYNKVLESAGLTNNQIDSIELLGGLTRIPFLQESLKTISGMEKLNRTMNSDEAVALGATYYAATQSSAFIVKKINLHIKNNFDVSLLFNNHEILIYNRSSYLDQIIYIELPIEEVLPYNLTIATGNPLTPLSHFSINKPDYYNSNDTIKLTFSFNHLTIPILLNATLNDTLLSVDFYKPSWTVTQEDLIQSHKFIKRMDEVMEERRRLQQVQNDYESYLYKIKEKLEYDNIFKRVINNTEQEILLNSVNEHQQWLFSEHVSPFTEIILKEKLNQIQDLMRDPEMRAEQLIKRAPAFQLLNRTLILVNQFLTITCPKERPWLTEDQTQNLRDTYNFTYNWFIEKYTEQLQLNDTQNPCVKVSEIDIKKYFLEHSYNSTLRIKKPTPTPSPPPPTPIPNNTEPIIDLNQTNIDLNQTNIDLNQTNIELNQTNIDLNQTNIELNQTNIETNNNNTKEDL